MPPSSRIGWLLQLSWPALRQQWGRQTLALLAIALGVALATAVQLINSAGLREFDAAARALSGQADLELTATTGALDEALFARLAEREDVLALGPMLEGRAQLLDAQGQPFSLRLLGVDMLQLAQLQPELLPVFEGPRPPDLLADGQLFLNPAALQRLGADLGAKPPAELSLRLQVQGQARSVTLRLAGRTATAGAPLAVLDIAVAQALLGRPGELDRIALRLLPGLDPQAVAAGLALPPQVRARTAAAAESGLGQAAQLSQAYRVNLGVLSLMALFVGGFLVFAVHTLSVAQRLPQLALLGVLGMSARERAGLVLSEALLLGLLGSLLGVVLGIGLAALGLELLGGDLGAGMLGGARPQLQLPLLPLLALGGLGLAVSLAAAALPVWGLRRLPAAQVLKGLGAESHPRLPRWLGPGLLLLGGLLSLTPPLHGLALGAYAAMLCLLFGGLAAVPALVDGLRRLLPRWRSALALLIRERAHDQAGEATRMLAGVLVALSLSVAMLVMVGSFRASLDDWLRDMLPADLFVRNGLRAARQEGLPLPPDFVQRLHASGLAERIAQQRTRELSVAGQPVLMLARELPDDEGRLPLTGALAPPGALPVIYVNEAMRDQLRLRPGDRLVLELAGHAALAVQVRGVWRDYSRQSPALLIALADYRRWSGDTAATDLMLHLPPGAADMQALQQRIRALAERPEDIELAAAGELRRFSLQLFDRSFAVTYWLQAVALGVGLFGVAASLSAQVLARRREFGLLLHLGFERRDVRAMVVAEALLFGAAGAIAGLLLGLAISAVLVWVLNPQSFHWSMDMHIPLARLGLMLFAVLLASALTAWWAARAAAGPDALQSVKEDW